MYSRIESQCMFSKLLCSNKTNYQYVIMQSIDLADQIWMQNRSEEKFRLIRLLLEQNPNYCVVKVSNKDAVLMYHFVQVDRLSIQQLDVSNLVKYLLGWYKVTVIHSAWTPLYDLDLCIWDKNQLNIKEKTILQAQSMLHFAKTICASVTSMPFDTYFGMDTDLHKMGFRTSYADFSMQLAINPDWSSFDVYLDTLKKKYRKRAKDIRDKGKDLENVTLDCASIEAQSSQLFSLHNQLIDRQKFSLNRIAPSHFYDLKKVYGNSFQVEALYYQGEMCAFISYFIEDKHLKVHYIGIDYTLNSSLSLYFNILYFVLEFAINGNFKTVDYGRTSLDAKASLGAVPLARNLKVKTRGLASLLKCFVLAQFAKLEDDQWKQRQVFK